MSSLNNILKAEIPQLRSEANSFQNHADGIKQLTAKMLELVEQSRSVWEGIAQTTYVSKFSGLSDDMDKLYRMCTEYSEDLIKIADIYDKTEDENNMTANSLKAEAEIPYN